MDITAVADEAFSAKMLGDGFAVEPQAGENVIRAPFDGKVALLADTLHAVAVESHKAQLLIHIGVDTVDLGGQGFTAQVEEGAQVRKGQPLISFDREYIESQGKDLTIMVVLTNMYGKIDIVSKNLSNPQSVLKIQAG